VVCHDRLRAVRQTMVACVPCSHVRAGDRVSLPARIDVAVEQLQGSGCFALRMGHRLLRHHPAVQRNGPRANRKGRLRGVFACVDPWAVAIPPIILLDNANNLQFSFCIFQFAIPLPQRERLLQRKPKRLIPHHPAFLRPHIHDRVSVQIAIMPGDVIPSGMRRRSRRDDFRLDPDNAFDSLGRAARWACARSTAVARPK
jgi:hypothetical protein